jgi:hypothetical protein
VSFEYPQLSSFSQRAQQRDELISLLWLQFVGGVYPVAVVCPSVGPDRTSLPGWRRAGGDVVAVKLV